MAPSKRKPKHNQNNNQNKEHTPETPKNNKNADRYMDSVRLAYLHGRETTRASHQSQLVQYAKKMAVPVTMAILKWLYGQECKYLANLMRTYDHQLRLLIRYGKEEEFGCMYRRSDDNRDLSDTVMREYDRIAKAVASMTTVWSFSIYNPWYHVRGRRFVGIINRLYPTLEFGSNSYVVIHDAAYQIKEGARTLSWLTVEMINAIRARFETAMRNPHKIRMTVDHVLQTVNVKRASEAMGVPNMLAAFLSRTNGANTNGAPLSKIVDALTDASTNYGPFQKVIESTTGYASLAEMWDGHEERGSMARSFKSILKNAIDRRKPVITVAMGFSGTGKTTLLMGTDPGIQGVKRKYGMIERAIQEFNLKLVGVIELVGELSDHTQGTFSAKYISYKIAANETAMETLMIIEDERIRTGRIIGTANNSESSRSHLFVMLETPDGVPVLFMDCGGREDPISILETFLACSPKSEVNAQTLLTDLLTWVPEDDVPEKVPDFLKGIADDGNQFGMEWSGKSRFEIVSDIIKRGMFINETINHLTILFQLSAISKTSVNIPSVAPATHDDDIRSAYKPHVTYAHDEVRDRRSQFETLYMEIISGKVAQGAGSRLNDIMTQLFSKCLKIADNDLCTEYKLPSNTCGLFWLLYAVHAGRAMEYIMFGMCNKKGTADRNQLKETLRLASEIVGAAPIKMTRLDAGGG